MILGDHLSIRQLPVVLENAGAFAVNEIALWPMEVTVERCGNFVHPEYTSFSPGTDASYRVVLQVVALRGAVREATGRQVI